MFELEQTSATAGVDDGDTVSRQQPYGLAGHGQLRPAFRARVTPATVGTLADAVNKCKWLGGGRSAGAGEPAAHA